MEQVLHSGGALLQRPGGFGQEDVGISPEICQKAEGGLIFPIQSMYGIFTYIWLIVMENVGKYRYHTWMVWDWSKGQTPT